MKCFLPNEEDDACHTMSSLKVNETSERNRRLVLDEQLHSSLYDIIRTCHNAIVGHVGIHRLKSMLTQPTKLMI